jgi:hypothetical protein
MSVVSDLFVDGHRVASRFLGSGPPLLAPECNDSWTSTMVDAMCRDFTLIVATPTDFGVSERVGAPYVPARWATEVQAVLDHLGVDRCGCSGTPSPEHSDRGWHNSFHVTGRVAGRCRPFECGA